MEKENLLDNQNIKPSQKKLWTIRLLYIGGLLSAFTFFIAINLSISVLVLGWLISFGTILAGFIIGFIELKKNKRALIGIIGNLMLILLIIISILSSIRSPEIIP